MDGSTVQNYEDVARDGYLKLAGTVANWHRIYKKWVYSEPRDVSTLVRARAKRRRHLGCSSGSITLESS